MKKAAILAAAVAMAAAAFAIPNTIETFTPDGYPLAPEGFGLLRNTYVSGRVVCRHSAIQGLSEVSYVGRQPHYVSKFFVATDENSAYARIFVPQVIIDGDPYRLTYANTVHYPFGYTSECTVGDVKFEHAMVLDNNVILRRIRVVENPKGRKVRARIVQMDNLMRNRGGNRRQWTTHGLDIDRTNGVIRGSLEYHHRGDGGVVPVEIGAMNPVAFPINSLPERVFRGKPLKCQGYRIHLEETQPSDDHFFYMVFDRRADEDLTPARLERVIAASHARRKGDLVVKSGNPAFDSGVGMVPEMARALEIERTGNFRAGTHYWSWVWDTTVHADKLAMCGGAEEVKRMLEFIHEYGLQFSYGNNLEKLDWAEYAKKDPRTVKERLLPGVALFFVNLLNGYYQATGDEETKARVLPTARLLVERALAAPADGEPFSPYSCFYPDRGECVDEQDSDWCLINQAVYWQGLCAWHELTGENGDDVARVKAAFERTFWDEREGYWCDAYDPDANVQRPHYPVFGVLNISRFALEPKREKLSEIAAYMTRHFRMGVFTSMFDRNTVSWMSDGNQLGAYYPTTDRYYWNVRNAAGDLSALREIERTVAAHWKTCSYPEGQTADVMNADPADYSDNLSHKQFFAAKAFLCDALEAHLGIYPAKDGLRLRPMNDGRDFAVRNLHLRGNRLAIRVRGRGTDCRYTLNGAPVELKDGVLPWNRFASGDNELLIDVR